MKPDDGKRTANSRRIRANSWWGRIARKNRFFRLLHEDPRFRYTIFCGAFCAFLLGVCLPRIWIVSPREYPVLYRVRLFDIFATRLERRNAEKVSRSGDIYAALQLWERVLVYNPCDQLALRGLFRDVARQPQPLRQWFEKTINRAGLLYSISLTNIDDVAMVARVNAAYGKHSQAIASLTNRLESLTPFAAATLAIELIDGKRAGGFPEFWQHFGGMLTTNVEGEICHKAWEAGWGRSVVQADAKAWMEKAAATSGISALALRLWLSVDENNADIPSFRLHYKQLQDMHLDRITDAAAYWRLLENCGKRQTAIDLASAYNSIPQSASDGVSLVKAWRLLKLYQRINEFARGRLLTLRDDTAVWSEVGASLGEAGLWDDVRGLAASIRDYYELKVRLGGYASYLEGLAAHHQRERLHAIEYFQAAAGNLPEDKMLVFSMARGMREAGYDRQADDVLAALVGDAGMIGPWMVGEIERGNSGMNDELALGLVDELNRADPSNREGQRAMVAALIRTRQRPEEALRIAMALTANGAAEAKDALILAGALVQNAKLDETKELLARARTGMVNPNDKTLSLIIAIELQLAEGSVEKATESMADLDDRYLTPAQQTWLTKQKHDIRTKVKGAS